MHHDPHRSDVCTLLTLWPQEPVHGSKHCDRRPMSRASKNALAQAMTESPMWADASN
jgi:hypothetical protein